MEKQSKKPSAAGKRKKFPRVLKNVYLWVILYFFDFGSLGTSCYNHLLYRLFAILFQFFTNVFFQCYPLFLCLSFKDTYSPFTQLFVSVKLCAVGTIPISPPYIRLHNPRPLVHWRSSRPPAPQGRGIPSAAQAVEQEQQEETPQSCVFSSCPTGLRLKISRL